MISESFVLLYFRICARRANFSHLETLGFGYSSRQDAKNAKFGNLFLLCAFASLREMFRFFLVAASPRWVLCGCVITTLCLMPRFLLGRFVYPRPTERRLHRRRRCTGFRP